MKVNESNQFFQAKNQTEILSILKDLEKDMPPKAIAADLEIPLKSYYKIRRGYMQFPFGKLYRLAALNERVIELLLDPLGKQAIDKVRIARNNIRSILKLEINVSILDGKIKEAIKEVLEDGKVEISEYDRVHSLLNKGRRIYAQIDQALFMKVEI